MCFNQCTLGIGYYFILHLLQIIGKFENNSILCSIVQEKLLKGALLKPPKPTASFSDGLELFSACYQYTPWSNCSAVCINATRSRVKEDTMDMVDCLPANATQEETEECKAGKVDRITVRHTSECRSKVGMTQDILRCMDIWMHEKIMRNAAFSAFSLIQKYVR